MSNLRPPYISTDLRTLHVADPSYTSRDLVADGRAYRRLDPDYYAWLRHKMELARAAFSHGRLSEPAFDALRYRFNDVYNLAIEVFDQSALQEAMQRLDPRTYVWPQVPAASLLPDAKIPEASATTPSCVPPPRCSSDLPSIPSPERDPDDYADHQFPEEPGHFRFLQPVLRSALDKVHAIRERALAAGWTDASLYQNRGRFAFPCGNDYGLVCFVHTDQAVGTVTPRAIDVVCRAGHSLHFYRTGERP